MDNEKILSNEELLNVTAGANFISKNKLNPGNIAVPFYGIRQDKWTTIHDGGVKALYAVEPILYEK